MILAAPWMALTPSQLRALWARTPVERISARTVPWQPPSISPLVGSISTAKSPRTQSGCSRTSRPRPLRAASTSSWS